jgi:hypothetical protein
MGLVELGHFSTWNIGIVGPMAKKPNYSSKLQLKIIVACSVVMFIVIRV